MTINRFSKGPKAAEVTSEFISLPIDFIAGAVRQKQSDYDRAKATLDTVEDSLLKVKGLSADSAALKGISAGYSQKIDKMIEDVGGDLSRLNTNADVMARELKSEMATGQLGQIQSNFATAQKSLSDASEAYGKGDISKASYTNIQRSVADFKGTVETDMGWNKFSATTAPKFVNVGMSADNYGTEIADQYKADGAKFKSAKTASQYIYQNLIADTGVMDNIREEVRARSYGQDWSDEQYLGEIKRETMRHAKVAGAKIAYEQQFKKTAEDEFGNQQFMMSTGPQGKPVTMRAMTNVPEFSVLENLTGIDWDQRGTMTARQHEGAMMGAMFGVEDPYQMKDKARGKKIANQKIAKAWEAFTSNDMIKAQLNNLSAGENPLYVPGKSPKENFKNFKKAVEAANARTVETPMRIHSNPKLQKRLRSTLLDSGALLNMVVYDDSGNVVPKRELGKMRQAAKFAEKSDADSVAGQLRFAGQINQADSPYEPGTSVFSVFDKDGNSRNFYAEPLDRYTKSDERRRSQKAAVLRSRVAAAKQNITGVSQMKFGNELDYTIFYDRTTDTTRAKDNKTGKYLNINL